MSAAIAAVTVCVIAVKWKDFLLHAFDPVQAGALGLRMHLLHYGLLGLVALAVVGALQAVGVILAVALLIAPGAIAFLLSRTFGAMLLLSLGIAVTGSFTGVYGAFFMDSAPGPTIVLLLAIVFSCAFICAIRRPGGRNILEAGRFYRPRIAGIFHRLRPGLRLPVFFSGLI